MSSPPISPFASILFRDSGPGSPPETTEEPGFFRDLNLDQIVDAITAGREDYHLKPFFYTRLADVAAIGYRHEVMRDLEDQLLFQSVKTFVNLMRTVRDHLTAAEKLPHNFQKERWFLDGSEIYCDGVEHLLRDLSHGNPKSCGLQAFQAHLALYTGSDAFRRMFSDARTLQAQLAAIRYSVLIRDGSVTVRDDSGEIDYSAAIDEAFSRFKHGVAEQYLVRFPSASDMNHVEAWILELVAKLNPDVFLSLDDYCTRNRHFLEPMMVAFDREIQFYIAYLEYSATFTSAGLKFCYPNVSETSKAASHRDGFDLALAGKLIREKSAVVCNDFALSGPERILVVTGPNQGGKTTFARTFGQLHWLASLGCPVPGTEAQLFLFDRLFTHFERQEAIADLHGKLQDDLLRIHHILARATPNSILLMNEVFSSTTVKDAVYLSRKIMERLAQLDVLGVWVTFLDELASMNAKTVSIVAGVAPDDPTRCTYRLERKPADGLAYAMAVAETHGLAYAQLKERLKA